MKNLFELVILLSIIFNKYKPTVIPTPITKITQIIIKNLVVLELLSFEEFVQEFCLSSTVFLIFVPQFSQGKSASSSSFMSTFRA